MGFCPQHPDGSNARGDQNQRHQVRSPAVTLAGLRLVLDLGSTEFKKARLSLYSESCLAVSCRLQPLEWINAEAGLHFLVQLGVVFPELARLLIEGFGQNGKELGRVGGAVVVEHGLGTGVGMPAKLLGILSA